MEKVRSEVVLHCPHLLGNRLSEFALWLSDLEQGMVIVHVSDFEVNELDVEYICSLRAEESFCRLRKV